MHTVRISRGMSCLRIRFSGIYIYYTGDYLTACLPLSQLSWPWQRAASDLHSPTSTRASLDIIHTLHSKTKYKSKFSLCYIEPINWSPHNYKICNELLLFLPLLLFTQPSWLSCIDPMAVQPWMGWAWGWWQSRITSIGKWLLTCLGYTYNSQGRPQFGNLWSSYTIQWMC